MVHAVQDIDGHDVNLAQFTGMVVLICNVASRCGFTHQYLQLGALQAKYGPQGFVVIGAPCNQFGWQEPGCDEDIKEFALEQGANFPMLAKLEVNGANESPLYTWLKGQQKGFFTRAIKWNFTKFLVSRDGDVVGRYPPTTNPRNIESDIIRMLPK